jgi:cytochrome b561
MVTWDDQRIMMTRAIHKYLGITTFLLAMIVLMLGLLKWASMAKRYYPGGPEGSYGILHIVFSVLFIVLGEVCYQRARYGKEAPLTIANSEF